MRPPEGRHGVPSPGRRRAGARAIALFALLALTGTVSAAEPPPPSHDDLTARLSSGATAMEYWDVTAWLDSGERLFARFLVTNQGPDVRTAAAVGHLVRPGGEVVPFKWGRRRDDWKIDADRASLKIAKARLHLTGPTVAIEIDSEKHGVQVRLEIARGGPLVTAVRLPEGYAVDVVMPAPATGSVWTPGTEAARPVRGTGAVTHTWMEQPEGDLLRARIELFLREGDVALYLSDVTLANGTDQRALVGTRAGKILDRSDDVTLDRDRTTTVGGDPDYPVATGWQARSATVAARVDVRRELLRMNPLDVLPQPFRMLLALGGRPQRAWADTAVDATLTPRDGGHAVHVAGTGITAYTFARPVERK